MKTQDFLGYSSLQNKNGKLMMFTVQIGPGFYSIFRSSAGVSLDQWKASFEKNCFSASASTLNMGLINKGWYGMFVACGIWCLADVSSVSPSSEQTEFRSAWSPEMMSRLGYSKPN